MGRIITYICFQLALIFAVTAQEYKVESFEIIPNDLTARTDSRVDGNGRKCGVIKIYVKDVITEAAGPTVGDIIDKGFEKRVYVSHDAKQIELYFKEHIPLRVTFDDYNLTTLSGNMTYILKLKEDDSAPVFNSYLAPDKSNNIIERQQNIESICGCNFELPSSIELQKTKLTNGMKIFNLRKGAFKDAGVKENYIITEINGRLITSLEDIIDIIDEVMGTSEEKIIITKGKYPNGKQGYYAINFSN